MPLISVIAIVMIIGGIVAINAEKILSCGVLVLIVVAIHNFCGMMLGLLAAKLFHVEYTRTTAIAIEVGMQNSGTGSFPGSSKLRRQPTGNTSRSYFLVYGTILPALFFASIRRSGVEKLDKQHTNEKAIPEI